MTTYDVCVFGAGPSGSVIARKLAEFGYSVVVVEKEIFPRHHIGLSMTPGINHWLELLGVKEQVENAGFAKALSSIILWENNTPVKKYFTPDSAGYHVNRGRFDEILLCSAMAAGARLVQPCSQQYIKQSKLGNWEITVKQNSSLKHFSATFIVEATGRKSIIRGTKYPYLPSTLATYSYWHSESNNEGPSIIEAGANHWYWGVPVPGLGMMACVFSGPKDLKNYLSPKDYYLSKISSSNLLAPLLGNKMLKQLSVCSATPYADKEPVSTNYIKVGDAAFSTDPLSSQGVQKAIKTAFQGAIVVNTILSKKENSGLAIDFYNKMITAEINKNTKWTRQLYNKQNRYTQGEFWDARKDSSLNSFLQPVEKNIVVKKGDKLCINPKAIIVHTPVVCESLIESGQGIIVEDETFVFLQNTPLLPMLRNIHDKDLLEGLKIIQSFMHPSNPIEILKWLLYNKLLCPLRKSGSEKNRLGNIL